MKGEAYNFDEGEEEIPEYLAVFLIARRIASIYNKFLQKIVIYL